MSSESIVAIVAIAAMLIIGAITFVTLLAVFCYKRENILFKSSQETDVSGIKSKTTWSYDNTSKNQHSETEKQRGL